MLRRLPTGDRIPRTLGISARLSDELHENWMVYGLDVFSDTDKDDTPEAFLKLSSELGELSRRRSVQFEVYKLDADASYRFVFLLVPRGIQKNVEGAIRKLKQGGLSVELDNVDQQLWALSDLL